MSRPNGAWREKGCLFDALSRAVKAHGRGLTKKNLGYRKIRPTTMTCERYDACELSDVILQENSDADMQVRAFHFVADR